MSAPASTSKDAAATPEEQTPTLAPNGTAGLDDGSVPCSTSDCTSLKQSAAVLVDCLDKGTDLCLSEMSPPYLATQGLIEVPDPAWSSDATDKMLELLQAAESITEELVDAECWDKPATDSQCLALVEDVGTAYAIAAAPLAITSTGPTAASTTAPTPPPSQPPVSGSGDSVVPVSIPAVSALVLTYSGGSNFIVKTDTNDLLVNEVGSYSGTVPVALDGTPVTNLIITASGPWTVQIVPLDAIEYRALPTSGSGDSVFMVLSAPGAVPFTCGSCEGNVVLKFVSANGEELLVNHIDSYSGTLFMKGGGLVIVRAKGAWSLG